MNDSTRPCSSDVLRRGRRGRFRAGERGFTLTEILVALTISTVVTLTAYSVLYSSQRMQSINEQTTQTQQNARIAMELITQDLKAAGFNSQSIPPPGIGTVGAVGTCGTNGILPGDNNAAGADTGPDRVSMIVPVTLSTLATQITGAAPTPNVVLQSGAVAAAAVEGFGTNAPYALPNPVVSLAGVQLGTVTAKAGDTLTLSGNVILPTGGVLPVGTQVYWLKCIMYKVISTASNAGTEQPLCGGTLPCLVRGTPPCLVGALNPCVAVVDGIEDLQVSYACDGCVGLEDGVIDDQAGGAAGAFDTADFVSNSSWNAGAFIPQSIRMVQVSVVARQLRATMKGENVTAGTAIVSPAPLVIQDHNHANGVFAAGDLATQAALTTYTQTQRRVLTRTVQLKNMGLF